MLRGEKRRVRFKRDARKGSGGGDHSYINSDLTRQLESLRPPWGGDIPKGYRETRLKSSKNEICNFFTIPATHISVIFPGTQVEIIL